MTARTLGRFNFISVKTDCFEVIYKPMLGGNYVAVAKDLSREQATNFMDDLNGVIDDFREECKDQNA
jgi:hypothetical protein